jgi:hypothetical protein
MATLDIEGQHVNVDDSFLSLPHDQQQSTVEEIASSLKAKPAEGSSLSGMAKSLGTGLAQGAIGLAGIPADLAHLYADNPNDPNPLGSQGLQKKVEQYTGDFYKPQGTAEDIASKMAAARTAAKAAPSAEDLLNSGSNGLKPSRHRTRLSSRHPSSRWQRTSRPKCSMRASTRPAKVRRVYSRRWIVLRPWAISGRRYAQGHGDHPQEPR